jgi:hypothetical protein
MTTKRANPERTRPFSSNFGESDRVPIPTLRGRMSLGRFGFCPSLPPSIHVTLVGLICFVPSTGTSGLPDVPIRNAPDILVGHRLLSPSGRLLFRYKVRLHLLMRRCPFLFDFGERLWKRNQRSSTRLHPAPTGKKAASGESPERPSLIFSGFVLSFAAPSAR